MTRIHWRQVFIDQLRNIFAWGVGIIVASIIVIFLMLVAGLISRTPEAVIAAYVVALIPGFIIGRKAYRRILNWRSTTAEYWIVHCFITIPFAFMYPYLRDECGWTRMAAIGCTVVPMFLIGIPVGRFLHRFLHENTPS